MDSLAYSTLLVLRRAPRSVCVIQCLVTDHCVCIVSFSPWLCGTHFAMEHIMASSRGRSCKMCFVVKMVVKERRGSIFEPNAFFFIFRVTCHVVASDRMFFISLHQSSHCTAVQALR